MIFWQFKQFIVLVEKYHARLQLSPHMADESARGLVGYKAGSEINEVQSGICVTPGSMRGYLHRELGVMMIFGIHSLQRKIRAHVVPINIGRAMNM